VAAVHTFYSPDSPELQIGEPVREVGDNGEEHTVRSADIVFRRGFADVELTERNLKLIDHTRRTYPLEDLGPSSDVVAEGTTGSATCPECGKTLKTPLALKGHLRSHKPA
jgi:hypothetical protein